MVRNRLTNPRFRPAENSQLWDDPEQPTWKTRQVDQSQFGVRDGCGYVKLLVLVIGGGGPYMSRIYVVLHRPNGQEHLFLTEVDLSGEPPDEVLAVAGEDVPDPQSPERIVSDRICLFKRGDQDAAGRLHYTFDRYTTP